MAQALAIVGYHISDTTVGNVLKQHGIEPPPDRKPQTTWKTFVKSHWDVLAAIDFTTIEVWTKGGLVKSLDFIALTVRRNTLTQRGREIDANPCQNWPRTQNARQPISRRRALTGRWFLSVEK